MYTKSPPYKSAKAKQIRIRKSDGFDTDPCPRCGRGDVMVLNLDISKYRYKCSRCHHKWGK